MVHALYKIGKRDINEDSYQVYEEGNLGIYLVADGCGGHASGDVASRMAVDILVEHLKGNDLSEDSIKTSLIECNEAIMDSQKKYGSMKTTIVGLVRSKSNCIAFNVGDSRLYQIRDGEVIFNTEDHAVPYVLYKAGIIEKSEINTHEDRNKLLEALGARPSFKINTYEVKPEPMDIFVLATDGLWEHIQESDFKECTLEKAKDWLQNIENKVTDEDDPEQDNYTALLIGGLDE